MTSFKNLEMAAAVSSHPHIEVKKSCFGLSSKLVYTLTQSPVKVSVYDYAPADGERVERLLNLSPEKLEQELSEKGAPKTAPVGHFRLEVCLSEDRKFCALQLFRFVDFSYTAASEARFYEGKNVETIVKLF